VHQFALLSSRALIPQLTHARHVTTGRGESGAKERDRQAKAADLNPNVVKDPSIYREGRSAPVYISDQIYRREYLSSS